ncbi:MAG: hypothetical protein ACP5DC_02845 [Halothiobacillaceae bacterium]
MAIPLLSAALALLLPWTAGTLLVARLLPGLAGQAPALALGYGYVVGFSLTIGLFWMLAYLTGGFQAGGVMLILAAVSLGLVASLHRRYRAWFEAWCSLPRRIRAMNRWALLLVFGLIALIGVRWLGLLVDVSLRPVFAWDAFTAWTLKAHSMFASDRLLDFVDQLHWLKAPTDPTVQHAMGHHYPLFVSLVQVWMADATGQWHEAWVNLPWPFLWLSMMLVVFGQLRVAGVTLLVALLGAYLLASLPLLSTHALLGGYADLWLTAFFGAATLALWQALFNREYRQLVLLILVLPVLLVTKNPNPTGMVLLMWLPLLWWAWVIRQPRLAGSAAVIAVPVVLGCLIAGCLEALFGPGISELLPKPENFPPTLTVLYHGAFNHANWHLLPLAMLLALLVSIAMPFRVGAGPAFRSGLLALAVFTLAALVIYLLVFSMPLIHPHIENFTLAQRALLYIAMPTVVWCALALHEDLKTSPWSRRLQLPANQYASGA